MSDECIKEMLAIVEHVARVFAGPKAPIGDRARAVLARMNKHDD